MRTTRMRSARGSNRIDQAKPCDHVLKRDGVALRILHPLQRKEVVFEILDVLDDGLSDVEGLRAPGFPGERVEPSLNLFGKSHGKCHEIPSSHRPVGVKTSGSERLDPPAAERAPASEEPEEPPRPPSPGPPSVAVKIDGRGPRARRMIDLSYAAA